MKYKDYVKIWCEYKKPLIKPSTFTNWQNRLRIHLIPFFGEYELEELDSKLLQQFIFDKFNDNLRHKSVRDLDMIFRLTVSEAVELEYIKTATKFIVKYPKNITQKKTITEVLNDSEYSKLFNYLMGSINYSDMGILISLCTGLRIGEVCALQWKDIDFNNKMISVSKTAQRIYIRDLDDSVGTTEHIVGAPKTASSYRTIPVMDALIDKLKTMRRDWPDENCVIIDYLSGANRQRKLRFGDPRTLRQRFERVLKMLGINHHTFHALRHTFASKLIEMGIDPKTVSELLGHSDINTTLNLYVHPNEQQKRDAVNALLSKKGLKKKIKTVML